MKVFISSVIGGMEVAGPFILVPASELAFLESNWRQDEARTIF